MQLKFTKHARERMTERGITDEQVQMAIESPDKMGRSFVSSSRFITKKLYFNLHLAKKHLLIVIYEERGNVVTVITIIDTSKIEKYF